MHKYDQRPGTGFSEGTQATLAAIREAEYAVLVGRNNCGKSFVLKTITTEVGQDGSYLGPARYQNFHLLGHHTPTNNRKGERFQRFINEWRQQNQNIDNSPLNLQQAIAELSDQQRETLTELVQLLLGVELSFLHTVPGNSMSQKYIAVGGHNLSYTSSGFRLIITLLTSLLDDTYSVFLVDEPELGISPEAQGVLADFLFDRSHRAKYFPHIRTLILATHSTVFLDRNCISNNYVVTKVGDQISVDRIITQTDFNRVHFFLLGNRFETLFLPSLIVIVEGKTDHAFVERTLTLRFPKNQFSIINATSDSRIREIVHMAKNLLTDIQRSPYRERIIAVLDSVHGAGLTQSLVTMGLPAENVVVWSKNGIEHFYPPTLLDEAFGGGGELTISGDVITRNGISYTKSELADRVTKGLRADTPMAGEFETQLVGIIARRLG